MHYYVYPKGGNGEVIAEGINFFNALDCTWGGRDSYSFVDDSIPGITLKEQLEIICQDLRENKAEILIASKRWKNDLLHNLRDNGVLSARDGIEWIAKKFNQYFSARFSREKVVAVLLDGYGVAQKHLGSIPRLLQENGLKVVYLMPYDQEWKKELEEKMRTNGDIYFVVIDELLGLLDFYPFLIFQNERLTNFNPKVTSLKLFVTAEQIWNQAIFKIPSYSAFEAIGNSLSTYVNAHGVDLYHKLQQRQADKDVALYTNFLKGGYPSIDKQIDRYIPKECLRDTLIFVAPSRYGRKMMSFIKSLIEYFLGKYRILFKGHLISQKRSNLQDEICFREQFLKYDNFIYYTEPTLSNEELDRSICLVTIYSSMGYSYPPIAKRPALLIYPDDNGELDTYFNDKIHIKFHRGDFDGIINAVDCLANNLDTQKLWHNKIIDYCKNDLFNYGCASEFIAKWICDWYNNREILKGSR